MSPKGPNGLTIVYANSNNIHYNENNGRSIPADIEGTNHEDGTESSDNNVYKDDNNDDKDESTDDDDNNNGPGALNDDNDDDNDESTDDDDDNNNGPGALIPSNSNHIKHPSDSAEQLYKKHPTRDSTHNDKTIMDVIRENNEMDTAKHGEVSPTMMSMMSIGSIQI
eukprot:CAMPEP_0114691344 /NCGR_PEP_ID=MMETSP0191-20121206/66739_1 /TAXON_ID=126664 /ORGANISM="Sorites sp." /LENGTH=166 /DNA_ID=CAMNT_0001982443 /DNA_START=793 /DNA_END=1294 /DNA_ORIENTATION=-